MKLTQRGFTLVELMIVIAIIGILAAALFPSLTAYLKRSRDAARTSNLKDISTALGGYYSDKEAYPNGSGSNGCLNLSVLSASYLEGVYPVDPTSTKYNGCDTVRMYSYASGVTAAGLPHFAVGAIFENENGGNFLNGTGQLGAIMTGATMGVLTTTEQSLLDSNIAKGNGSGYVLYK